MSKKIESFPISEEAVREFIEINKSKWTDIEYQEGAIYLNFSMVRMQAGWIIPKLLYAKGMQEQLKCKVYVLTWDENPLLTKLFESYGFEHIALNSLNNKHIGAFFKAGFQTLGALLGRSDGEALQKLEINGMNVGRLLYEDIIRTSSLSTIRSTWNKICIKKMLHILWTVYSLEDMIKHIPPTVFINDDTCYHEGLFIKLFHNHGARVYGTDTFLETKRRFDEQGLIIRNPADFYDKCHQEIDNVADEAEEWSENFLKERFEGKNGREIDRGAFAGKKVITREELISSYGLDPSRKNVVIMAHTFTDAIYNYGITPFRDYYDWLEQTLRIAGDVDGVNWILKPHPTRGAYDESTDSIELMYERYKKSNIHMLTDDVSAESIKHFADVIVTIGGNAGGEFACLGVPAVIVGKPFYAGFGYTIEPKTAKEYEEVLHKAGSIEPLTAEQIKVAKQVFYIRNRGLAIKDEYDYPSDEFGGLVNKLYSEMIDAMTIEYFTSNAGTDDYNTKTLGGITDYMKSGDVTKSAYYRKGAMRALENE